MERHSCPDVTKLLRVGKETILRTNLSGDQEKGASDQGMLLTEKLLPRFAIFLPWKITLERQSKGLDTLLYSLQQQET